MKALRTIAGAAGAAFGLAQLSVLYERHRELVDLLEEIADKAGILLALEDLEQEQEQVGDGRCVMPGNNIPANDTSASPIAAVIYGPGTGKVAIIHADGGRTIRSAPAGKWDAVASIARHVDGIDVDAIEAQLLADHRGVKEIRFLKGQVLNRATTRLLDQLTKTPTGGD